MPEQINNAAPANTGDAPVTNNSNNSAPETVLTNDKTLANASDNKSVNTDPTAKDGNDKAKAADAPIEYKDFKLPEGFEVNQTVMNEFKTFAQSKRLSQEDAQALIDLQTKVYAENSQATQKALQDKWRELNTEWANTARNDKEYGGAQFDANLGLAKKAIETFGNQEFRDAIELTGMGNHPELIRFLVKVGKAMSEDGVLKNGAGRSEPRDPASILFPTMEKSS